MENEAIANWETLWKGVFLLTLLVFATMSVWVTIGGYRDLKLLLKRLKDNDTQDSQ